MRELAVGNGPDASAADSEQDTAGLTEEQIKQKETERLMKAAWEAMLIEGMDGMAPSDVPPATTASASAATSDFQSKIKQTMDKLKESEDNLQVPTIQLTRHL